MNSNLVDPAFWSRLQFAFRLTYHYLFPQLTMGLAWFLVYWKWRALRTGDEKYNQAVRFWAKIFGLNFAVGGRIARGHRLDHHGDFGPLDSPGSAGLPWIEWSPGGLVGHLSRGYFPRDALFDSCAREFIDSLRRRCQPACSLPRLHLVAGGFRACGHLFRLHLVTLRRKSQRQARQPRVLLEACCLHNFSFEEIPHRQMLSWARHYEMNSGIPFVKLANSVEVNVALKGKRVSGPPLVFKQ
jgi:Cytochrome bd terminal oxidase subunit I